MPLRALTSLRATAAVLFMCSTYSGVSVISNESIGGDVDGKARRHAAGDSVAHPKVASVI
jgi:hypothetical protein